MNTLIGLKTTIPFYRPSITEAERQAVLSVLDSGYLTQGPLVKQVETEFAAYIGAPYAVAVSSCTMALFLCCYYTNREQSYAVTIPAITFPGVATAIIQAGSVIEFIDEVLVGKAYELTNTGRPLWDCAHQISQGMYRAGAFMCYSFYATKEIASCDGGMIVTDDKEAVDWFRKARLHGRDIDSGEAYRPEFIGWKCNMTDVQAAIILTQLHRKDELDAERSRLRDQYNKAFKISNKSLHLYPVLVRDRNICRETLARDGIETSVHYPTPLYQCKAFFGNVMAFPDGHYFYSDYWANHEISLPFYVGMTDDQQDYVIERVIQWRTKAAIPKSADKTTCSN